MNIWMAAPFLLFLFPIIALLKNRKKEIVGDDRLSKMYRELREIHQKKQHLLIRYWLWAGGAALLGWILCIVGLWLGYLFFIYPGVVSLVFFFSFMIATIGLLVGKRIDNQMSLITLKGIRVEKRLQEKDACYFSKYLWKRKGGFLIIYILFRLVPFLLILFPLYFYGVYPLLFSYYPNPVVLKQGMIEIFPLAFALFIIMGFLALPYLRMIRSFKTYG